MKKIIILFVLLLITLTLLTGCKGKKINITSLKDEDGYLNKDLYLDRDLMKREIASRKYICAGCENYQANFDCPYWKKCLRAFEIGQKSKKSKG